MEMTIETSFDSILTTAATHAFVNVDQTKLMLEKQTAQSLTDRVLHVLKDTLDKMKIALILPLLIKDKEKLKNIISKEDMKTLSRYGELLTANNKNSLSVEHDNTLFKTIDIVLNNSDIWNRTPFYLNRISSLARRLLEEANDIYEVAELRLKTHASSEILREHALYKAYYSNIEIQALIKTKQEQLNRLDSTKTASINDNTDTVERWREKLDASRNFHLSKLQGEMAKYWSERNKLCNEAHARQEQLEQEAKKWRRLYNNILDENRMTEKKLRERSTRFVSQLVGWVKKYDEDMKAKILDNIELNEKLELKKQELEDFMEEFKRREAEYYEVFPDRKLSLEEKLERFAMNRAARIIQTAWRTYNNLKKAKLSKKKGKVKGKKGGVKQKGKTEKVEEEKKSKPKKKKKEVKSEKKAKSQEGIEGHKDERSEQGHEEQINKPENMEQEVHMEKTKNLNLQSQTVEEKEDDKLPEDDRADGKETVGDELKKDQEELKVSEAEKETNDQDRKDQEERKEKAEDHVQETEQRTAEEADKVTEEGDKVAEGGDNVTEGGDKSVEGGDKSVEGGDKVAAGGEKGAEGVHNVTEGGDKVTEGGEKVTEGGEKVTAGGEKVTKGGEKVTEEGEKVTEGGEKVTEVENKQGQVENKQNEGGEKGAEEGHNVTKGDKVTEGGEKVTEGGEKVTEVENKQGQVENKQAIEQELKDQEMTVEKEEVKDQEAQQREEEKQEIKDQEAQQHETEKQEIKDQKEEKEREAVEGTELQTAEVTTITKEISKEFGKRRPSEEKKNMKNKEKKEK